MPVIPTAEATGKLDPSSQLMPRTEFNESAAVNLSQGAVQLGNNVRQLASSVQELGTFFDEKAKQKEDFDTAVSFEKLKQAQSADDLDAANGISADGTGYAEGRAKSFNDRFDSFLKELPERQRGKYALQIESLRTGHLSTAAKAQQEQGRSYAATSIEEKLNGSLAAVTANPGALNASIDDTIGFINGSTLTAEEKRKLVGEARVKLQTAAFNKSLDSNDPTDGAQANRLRTSVTKDSPLTDRVFAQLIRQESGGNPNAVSNKGALGVTQVMPDTARQIARERGDNAVARMSDGQLKQYFRENPQINIAYGRYYFDQQLDNFNGDVEAALVAYNGGPRRAQKWLASGRNDAVIPEETRNYKRVILGRVNLLGSSRYASRTSGTVGVQGQSVTGALSTPEGEENLGNDDVNADNLPAADAITPDAEERIKREAGEGSITYDGGNSWKQGRGKGPAPGASDGWTTFRGEGKYTKEELDAADQASNAERERSIKAGFTDRQIGLDGRPNLGAVAGKPNTGIVEDMPEPRRRSLEQGYMPSQIGPDGRPLPGAKPAAGADPADPEDLPVTVSVRTPDGKWMNVETVRNGQFLTASEVRKGIRDGSLKGKVYDSKDEALKAGGTEMVYNATRKPEPEKPKAPDDVEAEKAGKRASEKYQRRWSSYNDPDALGMTPRPTVPWEGEPFKNFTARQNAWDAEFKRRGAEMRRQDSDIIGAEREARADDLAEKREAREARAEARQKRQDEDRAHEDQLRKIEQAAFRNDPKAVEMILEALANGTIRDRQERDRILNQNGSVLAEFVRRGGMIDQKGKAVAEQARREKVAVKALQEDDIASIRETGKGAEGLTDERIRKAQGDDAADDHIRAQANAQRYFRAVAGMDSLPRGEIEARVNGLMPRGGAGFTDAQQTYDDARKKADQILKERNQDPAHSVRNDPAVRDALTKLNPKDPKSVSALGEARVAAQRAAGIPETSLSPITKTEADDFVQMYDSAPPGRKKEVLTSIVRTMKKVYGPNADRAMGVILDQENADDVLRRQAGRLMTQVAEGRELTRDDARILDDGRAANAEARAVNALDNPPNRPVTVPNPVARQTSIPRKAIDALRAQPELAPQFDEWYGPGSAAGILGVTGQRPAAR